MIARVRRYRALRLIERELGNGDPRLRVMFAIFARLARDELPTGPEPLSRGRVTGYWPVTLMLVVSLLAVGLAVGLVGTLAPASACPVGPYLASRASRPAVVSCPARARPSGTGSTASRY